MNYQPQHIQKRDIVENNKKKYKVKIAFIIAQKEIM